MSRGRRRRGGTRRVAGGDGSSASAPGAEAGPKPQAGPRKGGPRQKQAPQGGQPRGATPPAAEVVRRSGGRRRRRRSGVSRAEPSALEQMANRGPRVLQTLPADGLVAEEIIDSMREEYGYPATPQEYRLIVRVAPDEAERQGARRRREPAAPAEAATAAPDEATDGDGGSDVPRESPPTARRGRLRRRRRGRGRGGGTPGADGGEPPAPPGQPPQDPPASGGAGEPAGD
jgi:hypothetical protein